MSANAMDSHKILDEGLHIVDAAKDEGLTVRLMGAVATRVHCQQYGFLLEKLGREITDLDLMVLSRDSGRMEAVARKLGYLPNVRANLLFGRTRQFFENELTKVHLDVFYDKLDMCHVIDFRERLSLDYPTITLADIVLEKMQIVRIAEKDLQDSSALFLEHDIGLGREEIDSEHISNLLCSDWGFYYTVSTNLEKLQKYQIGHALMPEEQKLLISKRVGALLTSIEQKPKSARWKLRAKVGPRQQWYHDVEEAAHR